MKAWKQMQDKRFTNADSSQCFQTKTAKGQNEVESKLFAEKCKTVI